MPGTSTTSQPIISRRLSISDWFKDTMDRMLHTLKTTKPAQGHERVLYPGLSEHEEEQERRANGIPLHKEVIEWFAGVTKELGVSPLATM